jgi:hypothetical protein
MSDSGTLASIAYHVHTGLTSDVEARFSRSLFGYSTDRELVQVDSADSLSAQESEALRPSITAEMPWTAGAPIDAEDIFDIRPAATVNVADLVAGEVVVLSLPSIFLGHYRHQLLFSQTVAESQSFAISSAVRSSR